MPNFERYSVKQVQKEAGKMQEKIKSGETREYSEAEVIVDTESRLGAAREEKRGRAPGEVEINKQKWAEFAHSLKGVVTVLVECESQRMSLIEPGGIGRLAAGANKLEALLSGHTVQVEDLGNTLQGIAAGLKSIEDVRKPGMREDEESLAKAHARVRRVRDGIDSIRRGFSGSEEDMAVISREMNSLNEAGEHAGLVLAQKRQALREYLGR